MILLCRIKNTKEVNNADLLRRLSNLEKIIYGKDE